MTRKHIRPPVSAEVFDAQYEHSSRMAAHHTVSIQDKVDAYVKARKEDRDEQRQGDQDGVSWF